MTPQCASPVLLQCQTTASGPSHTPPDVLSELLLGELCARADELSKDIASLEAESFRNAVAALHSLQGDYMTAARELFTACKARGVVGVSKKEFELGAIIENSRAGVERYLHEQADMWFSELADESLGLGQTAQWLTDLGAGNVWTEVVTEELRVRIRKTVQKSCDEDIEDGVLPKLLSWMDSSVVPWLQTAHGAEKMSWEVQVSALPLRSVLQFPRQQKSGVQSWESHAPQVVGILLNEFVEYRISQTFDLIKLFPDSEAALVDFRAALEPAHFPSLVMGLREQFRRRLLIVGVETKRIILVYCKTVKAIGVIAEPHGARGARLVSEISSDIKDYLQKRSDTVRCVVASLTEEGGFLQSELQMSSKDVAESAELEWDEDDENLDLWCPEPLEGGMSLGNEGKPNRDLIFLLVSIYSSREVFVDEYKAMLATRLLSARSFDTSHERVGVERLKMRFGDASLTLADVMLNDISDSRRLHDGMGTQEELLQGLQAAIISDHFWPSGFFQSEPENEIKLPGAMQAKLDAYSNAYKGLKSNRKLEWSSSLGSVEVEVNVGDSTQLYIVSPIEAAVLYSFEGREEGASCASLAVSASLTETVTRAAVQTWIGNGVVKESSPDIFSIVEVLDENAFHGTLLEVKDEGVNLSPCDAEEKRKLEELILGLLKTYQHLPFEKLHKLVTMCLGHATGRFMCSELQLSEVLDGLSATGRTDFDGSRYSLLGKG